MKSALQRLVENAVQGGITLVVGAGVSFSRNLPSWQSLVEETWSAHFGRQKLPWKLSAADEEALEQLAQNTVMFHKQGAETAIFAKDDPTSALC